MILKRYNNIGLLYILHGDSTQSFTTVKCSGKEMVFNVPFQVMNRGWFEWMNGKMVQNAFPTLSPEEREFLMTGMTPEEWKKIFGPEE